ncbi:MAG: 3-dehydroquinate synthase [Simkaniaceae bacterium]|nr:3-dehydroquinate synthase [Simkaniaceae bacterium]MCF7852790.1 3-dehydroquinate synthase [Simkaniaceae bacterium]
MSWPKNILVIDKDPFQSELLYTELQKFGNHFAIIADDVVYDLYAKRLREALLARGLIAELFCFPSGECHKTRETKELLENAMLSHGIHRHYALIALGGGVTTDLAGFIASTYMRGLPLINIPTTLLGMVDASIGGKNGVNTSHGKNLIGTFYAPSLIVIAPEFLKTLPETEFKNGLSEIIKYGLIADPSLLKSPLSLSLIQKSIAIKHEIITSDFQDLGQRNLLNFGHTIGHAIERASETCIAHGTAIAMGMIAEARLSPQLTKNDHLFIRSLFDSPLVLPESISKSSLIQALHFDKKKRGSQYRYTCLERIGSATLGWIDEAKIYDLIDWLLITFKPPMAKAFSL